MLSSYISLTFPARLGRRIASRIRVTQWPWCCHLRRGSASLAIHDDSDVAVAAPLARVLPGLRQLRNALDEHVVGHDDVKEVHILAQNWRWSYT